MRPRFRSASIGSPLGLAGFQTKVLSGLILQVDQTAIVPIVLEPGAVNQTVEVTAAAPVLDSQTSSLGQVIENKRVVDLPLNGRNPFQLGVLSGGAVAFQGLTTNLPILAGGGRHNANDILLDGVDDNLRNFNGKVGRAGLTYIPSVDAVEEFKVKTNSFSAEYGHSAGYTMNATIKSGTNQLPRIGLRVSAQRRAGRQQLRVQLLGQAQGRVPAESVRRDLRRTGSPAFLQRPRQNVLLRATTKGLQIRQAATSSLLDMPPAAFRSGDFSSSTTKIYDPATRVLGPNGVATADPFPGNVIPTNQTGSDGAEVSDRCSPRSIRAARLRSRATTWRLRRSPRIAIRETSRSTIG